MNSTSIAIHPLGVQPAVPDGMDYLWSSWGLDPKHVADLDALLRKYGGGGFDKVLQQPGLLDHIQGIGAIVRDGLSSVVNTLTKQRSGFQIVFTSTGVAGTDMNGRKVQITSAPLWESDLPLDLRLAILCGAALHEVGHVREDRLALDGIQRAVVQGYAGGLAPYVQPRDGWTMNNRQSLYGMANLLADVRLERRLAAQYPAYKALFPITMWWVASTFPSGNIDRLYRTIAEGVTLATGATRYDEYVTWDADPALQSEREWWHGWAARHADTGEPDFVLAVAEGWAHILDVLASQPDGLGNDQPDEDGDQPGGKGTGKGKGAGICVCGCSQPAFAQPMKPGCTDGTCECHGNPFGSGDGGGSGDGDGGPESPDGGPESPDEPYRQIEPGGQNRDKGGGHAYGKADGPDDGFTEAEDDMAGEAPSAYNSGLPLHGPEQGQPILDYQASVLPPGTRRVDRDVYVTDEDAVERRVAVVTATGQNGGVRVSEDALAALAAAFTRKRVHHDSREIARSGRLSSQRGYRIRVGSDQVFTRRNAPSPDRLDVHLLIDASGSMGRKIGAACNLAATLATALQRTHTARVHVWAHNTGHADAVLWDVWDSRSGAPMDHIGRIRSAGGNRDGLAIAAVGSIARDQRARNERTILVVLSDGAPCESEAFVADCVAGARKAGTAVLSVAVEQGLTEIQDAMYGRESVVVWHGDWNRLATDLADSLGRVA